MLMPVAAHASPPAGSAQEPTADDLAMIREHLAAARSALAKLAALRVPEQSRQELDRRIQQAAEALSRYERLAQRGAPRKKAQGVLFVAGAAIVADDTTFIGTIDDALLPILAVGALATLILTHGPPTAPELDMGLAGGDGGDGGGGAGGGAGEEGGGPAAGAPGALKLPEALRTVPGDLPRDAQ
jgi:hypothetical protein